MDPVELRLQLERDRSWRWDELNCLQNICSSLADASAQDRFRRSLVLMLYAHFEGFVKNAFLAFSTALNADSLQCSAVNSAIRAASLAPLFADLRHPQAKSKYFGPLPDDTKLHRFARDREFVEKYPAIATWPIVIPDSIVDVESNLKPDVLKKILFRFGFQPSLFDAHTSSIHRLLNIRNNVAHGNSSSPVREREYETLHGAVQTIVNAIIVELTKAAAQQSYLDNAQSP